MSLFNDLNSIYTIKQQIKAAIESKGVSMSQYSFPDYPAAISEITTSFVTEPLSVSVNGTYTPSVGVDGFSEVVVDVPQSVSGYTEKDITEGEIVIVNLFNSASYVGSGIFKNNTNLLTVDLPNCVTVGNEAFTNCLYLSHISLPVCQYVGDYAFSHIQELISDIYLPECINVGKYAFCDCSQMTTIDLPNCVSVLSSAFMKCKSLSYVSLPVCKRFDICAFNSCTSLTQIDLPECNGIASQMFSGCINLLTVSAPNASYISGTAFSDCSRITELNFPKVIRIENSAFKNMYSLSSISLPVCESIGGLLFENCSSLTEIDLPRCNSAIGATFNLCSNLTTIKLPALAYVSTWYNNGVLLNCSAVSQLYIGISMYGLRPYDDLFKNVTGTQLQSGIGSIYVNAYDYAAYISAYGWSSLSSLFVSVGDPTIPLVSYSNGLIYGSTCFINNMVYNYLSINKNNVTELSLSECTVIGASAFRDAVNLSVVDLSKCDHINSYGFYNCASLETMILRNSSVCILEDYGINGTKLNGNNGAIYVPAGLVSYYQSAKFWSNYSSNIFPISE